MVINPNYLHCFSDRTVVFRHGKNVFFMCVFYELGQKYEQSLEKDPLASF